MFALIGILRINMRCTDAIYFEQDRSKKAKKDFSFRHVLQRDPFGGGVSLTTPPPPEEFDISEYISYYIFLFVCFFFLSFSQNSAKAEITCQS